MTRPMRLVLTRAEDDAEAWATDLRARGHHPIVCPCVACSPAEASAAGPLRVALLDADWLVLTSRRGVEAVGSLVGALPAGLRIACVGEATAAAARAAFGRVDLVPAGGTALDLARVLVEAKTAGARVERVVLAATDRADTGGDTLLAEAGVAVSRHAVYHTHPADASAGPLPAEVFTADYVLLASPSAALGLVARAGGPLTVPTLTLGPQTTAAARAAGLTVAGEARRRDLGGLLELLP